MMTPLDVECPLCKAPRGEWCSAFRTPPYRERYKHETPHIARVEEFRLRCEGKP